MSTRASDRLASRRRIPAPCRPPSCGGAFSAPSSPLQTTSAMPGLPCRPASAGNSGGKPKMPCMSSSRSSRPPLLIHPSLCRPAARKRGPPGNVAQPGFMVQGSAARSLPYRGGPEAGRGPGVRATRLLPGSSILVAHAPASSMSKDKKLERISGIRGPPGSRPYIADGWGFERPATSRPPRKRD